MGVPDGVSIRGLCKISLAQETDGGMPDDVSVDCTVAILRKLVSQSLVLLLHSAVATS